MKKVCALFLALCCMTGCGNTANSSAVQSAEQIQAESFDWFELDEGILTVRIPAEEEGYQWDITINDGSVLELLTQEETDNVFVASFRALEDGETGVAFSYSQYSDLKEIRFLNVICKDGKVKEISDHTTMEMDSEMEDDPEVTELRGNNSLSKIMQAHSAVTCVSETWDGENNWQRMTVRQFVRSGDRLWYDYEQYDDSDEVVYCEAGYVNDDVPGAFYTWEKDGIKSMTLCSSSEYEDFAADRWLRRNTGDYEQVTDMKTELESTILTVRRSNQITGQNSDVIYFTDAATGLLDGMEVTEYDPEDGSVTAITRSNILYDTPRLMEERAAMQIRNVEDPCYLTVIINPGQDNEEEQSFQVDKSTQVEFDAKESFQMFYDYDCTQPMDWIDVGQNKLHVYVTM